MPARRIAEKRLAVLVYQLELTLAEVEPRIWRRLRVTDDVTLHSLHLTFQHAMPLVEIRSSLPDDWSRALFLALLRRYGLRPYRYAGQRRTTVMARVARSFADEVLWPGASCCLATNAA